MMKWAPELIGSLADRDAQLRVPLSVFYCESVRRDLERELATRGQVPCWNDARELAGDARRTRLVPLASADVELDF